MATGAFPLDISSDVGKFRLMSGDSVGVPADPATDPQTAEYGSFSDAEITAYLTAGSVTRAIAFAYSALAASYAAVARTIQTDDLRISNEAKAREMQAIAAFWAGQADAEDARSAEGSFAIVDFTRRRYNDLGNRVVC